jgi:hypothetical protein
VIGGDPLQLGLSATPKRPGGNVTGMRRNGWRL